MTSPARRVGKRRPQSPARAARSPASERPIAKVALDIALPHLDRLFDYVIPESDSAAAQPGVRVRVRFAGRLVNGFVLDRVDDSDHTGRLSMIERVVSPEPVLSPTIARLCRTVADRYAGTLADVLRLAVPPRHARAENSLAGGGESDAEPPGSTADAAAGAGGWARYTAGEAFVSALREHRSARAVWNALPGEDWPARLAELALSTVQVGRGALLLVPDARDLARLEAALAAVLPPNRFVVLSADVGPAERYRRFLTILRGSATVVAGTRAAAFAPVRDLGLAVIFDDGDDSFAEPRAPYPHARETLMLRSVQEGTALVVGGFAATVEGQLLVESGWAHAIRADRAEIRRWSPRIEAAGDDYAVGAQSAAAHARLSPAAFAAARESLAAGHPVLVQVPRRGYFPGLACAGCRRRAQCRRCSGPLGVHRASTSPSCRWCGWTAAKWACPACAATGLRAVATGAGRTAEEIGRAFPGVRLYTSAGTRILDRIDAGPAIVVATPGAEPIADGGYGAALLLDGNVLLARPDLRAGEEAMRRWMSAAALVRPGASGGRVVLGADTGLPAVQALIRWDAAGFAAAELAARRELRFPPTVAMAAIDGPEDAVARAVAKAEWPPDVEVLGPVPLPDDLLRPGGDDAAAAPDGAATRGDAAPGDGAAEGAGGRGFGAEIPRVPRVRALLRVGHPDRKALASALQVLAASRSARKQDEPLRIQVDPTSLG